MNQRDYHACYSGDCPHETQAECLDAIREETLREVIAWFRSTSTPDDRQNVREIADEIERRFMTPKENDKIK